MILVLVAVVLSVAGLLQVASAAKASINVGYTNAGDGVAPKSLSITAGDTVVWIDSSAVGHQIIQEGKLGDCNPVAKANQTFSTSPLILGGKQFSTVFTNPGTYYYYISSGPLGQECQNGNEGTIIVAAAPPTPSGSTSNNTNTSGGSGNGSNTANGNSTSSGTTTAAIPVISVAPPNGGSNGPSVPYVTFSAGNHVNVDLGILIATVTLAVSSLIL